MYFIAKKSLLNYHNVAEKLRFSPNFEIVSQIFYWYFAHFNLIIIASLSNLNFSNGHIQTV